MDCVRNDSMNFDWLKSTVHLWGNLLSKYTLGTAKGAQGIEAFACAELLFHTVIFWC